MSHYKDSPLKDRDKIAENLAIDSALQKAFGQVAMVLADWVCITGQLEKAQNLWHSTTTLYFLFIQEYSSFETSQQSVG